MKLRDAFRLYPDPEETGFCDATVRAFVKWCGYIEAVPQDLFENLHGVSWCSSCQPFSDVDAVLPIRRRRESMVVDPPVVSEPRSASGTTGSSRLPRKRRSPEFVIHGAAERTATSHRVIE